MSKSEKVAILCNVEGARVNCSDEVENGFGMVEKTCITKKIGVLYHARYPFKST